MSESDNQLEKSLQSLEQGIPIERILEKGDASHETKSLVNLVAAIRGLPHPVQDGQSVQSQRREITIAAREKSIQNGNNRGKKLGIFTDQWWLIPAFGGLALLLVMMFIVAGGAGIYILGPRGAHAATLTDLSGRIQVSSSGNSNEWELVSNGDQVKSGQHIRTGRDSWVTLVFFDGTHTTLSPSTELLLTKIDGSWGNELQVILNQSAGQTQHQVVPLNGDKSVFNVLTPSGSASVRGTAFDVLVDETGKSMFKVDTGKVLVTSDGAETFVEAGQGLMTQTGKPLTKPNFLFVLQGEVNTKNGKTWTIAGVKISVTGGTREVGDTSIGKNVLVEGRITGSYEWIADSIHKSLTDDQLGMFTGVVNSIEGDNWQVNGIDFSIDDQTYKDEGIDPGDVVRVSFQILIGGAWKVTSVESLEGEPDDSEPPPPPDSDAHPILTFETEEDEQTACLEEYTFTGTLMNEAEGQDDVAEGVLLGFEIIEGKKYVDSVTFTPIGWEEILPGGSEEFDVKVSMNLDDDDGDNWESTPSGTEVKIQVYIAEETNWPDQPSRLTFTIVSECEGEPPDEDDDNPPDDTDDICTGTDQHPKALKILDYYYEYYPEFAEEIGLDYDTLMQVWFCDEHLGFGEIELMLGLSLKYSQQLEITAGEILTQIHDMRVIEGKGWGQIKKALVDQYDGQEEKGRPFKPEPPGKKKAEEKKTKDKPGKPKDD